MERTAAHSESAPWMLGALAALAIHAGALGLILSAEGEPEEVAPDTVMIIELPAMAAAAPSSHPHAPPQPQMAHQPDELPRFLAPRIDAPEVKAPLPQQVVAAPKPQPLPRPQRVQAQAQARPSPAARPPSPKTNGATNGTSSKAGTDPKAKEREVDYYSLLSAHLNRKKRYPREAKQAREQGVVTVRFTVHRDGSISGGSIKHSSGHDLLDQATLQLLRRVAPLPRIPRSLGKEQITLSLPIDYSLRTR